ncbi:alpha/beta hydrolase [Maribellus mangrovi]|uniref:alpha/beta hydrolase n=1 Tax=Maribellus mangrovi TaxID=3133146 RepID=UPI0030EC61F2
MKRIIFILIGFLILSVACQDEFVEPENDVSVVTKSAIVIPDGLTEGTVITTQFYSPSLEGNLLGDPALRNVNIYLPQSYFSCPDKRFPVIYYLHGIPASENALLTPVPYMILEQIALLQAPVDFPQEGFTQWINNLMNSGEVKEAIIVMPDASTKYGHSGYANSPVQGSYEDYIVQDLVPFIDENLRTIAHFNWRAVVGHSAGGAGALKLGMKYPHVFRHVAASSPGMGGSAGILFMAPYMLWEKDLWDGTLLPTTPYNPMQPYKFVTNTIYSTAAAKLPNPDNPPLYVDLPFTFSATGEVIPNEALMQKLDAQSLFALSATYQLGLKKLKTIFIDVGSNDDLLAYEPNVYYHNYLTQLKIKHEFEIHDGTHFSHLFASLGKALGKVTYAFPDHDD